MNHHHRQLPKELLNEITAFLPIVNFIENNKQFAAVSRSFRFFLNKSMTPEKIAKWFAEIPPNQFYASFNLIDPNKLGPRIQKLIEEKRLKLEDLIPLKRFFARARLFERGREQYETEQLVEFILGIADLLEANHREWITECAQCSPEAVLNSYLSIEQLERIKQKALYL